MSMEILGVDASNKSTDEIRHIKEALGLNDLSQSSLKKMNKFPLEMKQGWIDNPDSTGKFTDENVNVLYKSHEDIIDDDSNDSEENIDKAKIYSDDAAKIIRQLDKQAVDLAAGSYETSVDRQFARYNAFFDALKDSELDFTDDELDFVSEQVSMDNYDNEQKKFVEKQLENAPGRKFVVIQPSYVKDDVGNQLCDRIADIEDAVGERLGLPETKNRTIYITPTEESVIASYFTVYYTNELPVDSDDTIKSVLKDEIYSGGHEVSGFDMSDIQPVSEYELSIVKKKDNEFTKKPLSYEKPGLSKEAIRELEHAEAVIDNGYDDDGYNEDGFDETGHSKDGDYDSRYDKAFQGPDV